MKLRRRTTEAPAAENGTGDTFERLAALHDACLTDREEHEREYWRDRLLATG